MLDGWSARAAPSPFGMSAGRAGLAAAGTRISPFLVPAQALEDHRTRMDAVELGERNKAEWGAYADHALRLAARR